MSVDVFNERADHEWNERLVSAAFATTKALVSYIVERLANRNHAE